ncbi:MAG: hypothetical protein EON54_00975 [Alcaligenaceae bacterium]|nr:MAG: hypothetical protein EON54_00975 [Alcaligenaceae bacterium]
MANRNPEQTLINQFTSHVLVHPDRELRVAKMLNANCRSRKLADVEYISESGLRWVIEAKSDDSKDRHNTVHKIFGEVLKETGRTDRADCRHAILLPASALIFYSRAFRLIARRKFLDFGKLIPIDVVFLADAQQLRQVSWTELYDGRDTRS